MFSFWLSQNGVFWQSLFLLPTADGTFSLKFGRVLVSFRFDIMSFFQDQFSPGVKNEWKSYFELQTQKYVIFHRQ